MKFRIDPPKGASTFADTPEQAMEQAAKLLMMPSGSYMRFLKFLQDGQTVRWAYGFNEVWITPIRQPAA